MAGKTVKVSIIVPIYNEEKTIQELIDRLKRVPLEKEVIIVDDGSTDGTREILKKIKNDDFRIFYLPRNMGKGAAIRAALPYVRGEAVVIQDADLEYNPAELPMLLQPILEGKEEVVYGSRFLKGRPRMRFLNFIANKILAWTASLLLGRRLTDEATCYKAFRTSLLRSLGLKCKGFEFCPEVTAKIGKKGIRIKELPISYNPRTKKEGKKVRWKDGFIALYTLFKYRFFS
ncbi:glycosyltransferase family 2 protein [bacterium]|nr:glycosyltransferase family 2 protein [bacterium]